MQAVFRAMLVAACALGFALEVALADEVYLGRVVAVFDGDTVEVLVDGEPRRIRLAGIDTPERGQPWAERSKQALAARIFGKEVQINAVAVDRYGRTVGELYADNVCVGCELVREGHAWVYRRFTDDPVLLALEDEARAEKRGLWGLPESQRIPPWEWREAQRRSKKKAKRREAVPRAMGDFDCGEKLTCREMASCGEARFHLLECGNTTLDGDGDGLPCESLCREID